MCEDARWPWSRKEGLGREGGRRPAETDHSSRPAIHTRTDGRTPWLRRLPAPTSACSSAFRPPVALRSPGWPRHHRGCRQRRSGETGDGRAERRASSRQRSVRAGAAAPSVRPSVRPSAGHRAAAAAVAAAADRGKNHSCSSVSVAPLSQVDCRRYTSFCCVRIARREAAGSERFEFAKDIIKTRRLPMCQPETDC